VVRQFKRPENVSEKEIDAAGDGDVLVILDLRADQSLFEAGVAREVVNRIQKLRKTAQLEPSDPVDVYYKSVDHGKNSLGEILNSQVQYIRDALGSPLVPKEMAPTDVVLVGEESHDVHDMSFVIYIARSCPVLSPDLLAHASGNNDHVEALRVYLLSRSLSRLKNQFQAGNGMITVDCIEGYPAINLQLGKHVFLSAGDFYLASRS